MEFSHLGKSGEARMVDVSAKEVVRRTALAAGTVVMSPDTIHLLAGQLLKKGDALATARLAGIMAAKKTSGLIPLCHPLGLDDVGVDFVVRDCGIDISAWARCTARTGVEMEALVAVSAAALTLYDMCKAVDKKMVITDIRLVSKTKEALAGVSNESEDV